MAAERELSVRVSQNDRQAFVELYDLTAARVYAVILRSMDPGDEAAGLLREVFQQFWDERDRTSAVDRPLFLLIQRARRLMRSRGMPGGGGDFRNGEAHAAELRTSGPPAGNLDPGELLRRLYFDGETLPGLAEKCGLQQNALRATLLEAMDELQRELNAGKNDV